MSLGPARWQPTPALVRAALVSSSLMLVAVLVGRPDLLVLAAPLLLHTAFAVGRRPVEPPVVRTGLERRSVREGDATRSRTTVQGAGLEQVVVALTPLLWGRTAPAGGVAVVDARDDRDTEVLVELGSDRWGQRRVGGGAAAVTTPWEGWRWGPEALDDSWLTTLPLPGRFDSAVPAPHPVGVVGTHPSRRTGDGSELASVRPFAPGDRLRRVRWPVSLRTGTLHVTSTVAEQDASLVLLVDTGTEVGVSGGLTGEASSLDVAVRAAGAVAEHTLRRGDRVALRPLTAARPAGLPARSGATHLRRVLETLARMQAGAQGPRGTTSRLRVPAGAIAVVLSPLLADEAVAAVLGLARSGVSVVVVDTLPTDPTLPYGVRGRLAWRLRLLERDSLLLRLSRAGVPVVRWRGPGTLDEVLRGLGRRAHLPRVVAR
jgi:hypothetical protein